MLAIMIAVLILMMLVNIAGMAASRGGFSRAENVAFYAGALGILSIPVAIATPLFGGLVWALVGFPDTIKLIAYTAATCAVVSTIISMIMVVRLGIGRKP